MARKKNEEKVAVESDVTDDTGPVLTGQPGVLGGSVKFGDVEAVMVIDPPKAAAKEKPAVVKKASCLKCNDSSFSRDGSPFVCVSCGYEWE